MSPYLNSPSLIIAAAALAAFVAMALLTVSAAGLLRERRMTERVRNLAGVRSGGSGAGLQFESERLSRVLNALSRLSAPEAALHDSELRLRFARLGWRGARAPIIYHAGKTLLTLGLPLLALPLLLRLGAGTVSVWAGCLAFAAVGYLLPELVISWLGSRRSAAIREGLPDMIDLLLVCVESGLALDAAINRVSREIAARSPELSEEFHLAGLQIRAGARRIDALRNLAARSGVEEVGNLVSMLVQSERFGTSLGEALRVHSEFMRVRRTQLAEEMAAKVPLKILFPLILLIFPAILVVIIGPAGIQVATLLVEK
jgi:tight adherence protein C